MRDIAINLQQRQIATRSSLDIEKSKLENSVYLFLGELAVSAPKMDGSLQHWRLSHLLRHNTTYLITPFPCKR